MLGVPAQVAGCKNITLATPPRPDGSISPEIIYIAGLVGAQTVVRAGGAHAIAAMAYGTETVPKADKLYGPGNQFVTAAKMVRLSLPPARSSPLLALELTLSAPCAQSVAMDSGARVAIDVPAGPSEVLVRPPPSRALRSPRRPLLFGS